VNNHGKVGVDGRSGKANQDLFGPGHHRWLLSPATIPGHPDFADSTPQIRLGPNQLEGFFDVTGGQFESLGMEAAGWVDDSSEAACQVEDALVGYASGPGCDDGGNARFKSALDCAGGVGILVSVKMNVAIDHLILLGPTLIVRLAEAEFYPSPAV
jgi:hypothetical protein